MPVLRANVATGVGRNTTAIDDDTEDDETRASENLDHREDELDLTETLYTENVDDSESNKEDSDPDGRVDLGTALPELNRNTGSSNLEWQDEQPGDGVVPAHGETPRLVDEAADVCEESTVDRVEDSQFTKRLAGDENHRTDDDEAEELWGIVSGRSARRTRG